jgi:hypothetical protein
MSSERQIPNAVIATVADVMATIHFSHTKLNTLLMEAGAPGDPPNGNCVAKCDQWLRRCNHDDDVDAFEVLGKFIEVVMESDYPDLYEAGVRGQKRITDALTKHGLSYHRGGRILGGTAGAPTKSLREILSSRDLPAVEAEFDRALATIETDPAAALTAACALIESLLKTYIEDEGLELPSSETIKPLWNVVAKHLGLDAGSVQDDDIRRICTGLSSIVDGVGAFRTHAGSAHGRGRAVYQISSRHARLAIHAAHTLATFIIESWE